MNYKLIYTLILCFSASTLMHAQLGFEYYQTIESASDAECIKVCDLNNDGLDDVIITTGADLSGSNNHCVLIYYQNADGELVLSEKLNYYKQNSFGTSSLDVADLNKDGLKDIALTHWKSMQIFYQLDSTNFEHEILEQANRTSALKIGDLNNDGVNEICLTFLNETEGLIYSLDNQNNWQTSTIPTLMGSYVQLEIVDMNTDGLDDLVYFVATGLDKGMQIYLQNSDNELGSPQLIDLELENIHQMAIAHLDNNMKPDIIFTADGDEGGVVGIKYHTTTDLQFTSVVELVADNIPTALLVADLNCDNSNDIIVGHSGWHQLSIYEKNNLGNYSTFNHFPNCYGNYNRSSIACGDLNNDGAPDVAISADYLHLQISNAKPPISSYSYYDLSTEEPYQTTGWESQYESRDYQDDYVIVERSYYMILTILQEVTTHQFTYGIMDGYVCEKYVLDSVLIDSVKFTHIDIISESIIDELYFTDTIYLDQGANCIQTFPNPTNGFLNLSIYGLDEDIHLNVYNLKGQKILEKELVNMEVGYLDLRDLINGIFILEFIHDKKVIKTEKIIIQQ